MIPNYFRFARHASPGLMAFAVVVAIASTATTASAGITLGFHKISSNGAPDSVSSQFTVTAYGRDDAVLLADNFGGNIEANQALFVFQNNIGIQSSIARVYFQDGALLGIASIRQSTGVSFVTSFPGPDNLPGGNSINPEFAPTSEFEITAAGADSPPPHNGVNSATEWLGIVFNLVNGQTFADVEAALNNWTFNGTNWEQTGSPALRIGMHVISIGDSEVSEGFVSTPPTPSTVVPEPSTLAMAFTAFGLMGLAGLRRLRKTDLM